MKSATNERSVKARNPPAVHADGLRLARRTWDLNPRGFHLPVFKTGALGRYASPPWERLLETGKFSKIERFRQRADRAGLRLRWQRHLLRRRQRCSWRI